ncbi:hypothetical protein SLH49_12960 [Cognatiyoonia sp. IB215446]|uniref:hypothetical protein n=1 Tax=Cognatiyoonia sp. IB215446 TaxID=3097355 RepID=UPI002A0C1B65|nr:hypothetical protein [Cognatiyoonia sp. IB215446]MDX8348889.1 hypothetical protein [Cognatiyoonia sp. IB215446]
MMADFDTAVYVAEQAEAVREAKLEEAAFRRVDERIAKKEEDREEARADADRLLGVIVATQSLDQVERRRRLEDRLDAHQSAVVDALLDNQRRLDEMNERLDVLLEEAYELPDGRKVFKSEDGISVYDADGNQIDDAEIDPDVIPEGHPSWETYRAAREERITLEEERAELTDYQEKLDEADALIRRGDLAEDDFAELDSLLNDDVPDALRPTLLESDPSYRSAVISSEYDVSLDVSDFVVPATSMKNGM